MFRSFTLTLFPVTMCLLKSTVMGTTGRFEPLILEINFLVCDLVIWHVWKKAVGILHEQSLLSDCSCEELSPTRRQGRHFPAPQPSLLVCFD